MLTYATAAAAALAILAPTQEYAPQQDDGPQRIAPRGSYAQSCSGSYVNQGRLYADCRDTRGNVRGSSIELTRCSSSDIGNDNGLLICHDVRGEFEDRGNGGGNNGGGWGGNNGGGWGAGNGGGWGGNNGGGWGGGGWGGNNGGGWNGGGRASITVYADSNFRGPSASFSNEIPNLGNSGLNDAISSMEMRGEWEACSDRYFRGDCQRFTGSIRNLNSTSLNDRISSLRPVRGGGRW